MKCSEARERMLEYLDGLLKGEDLRELEAHLEQCGECRLELQSVQSLDARLKQEVPALWESIEPSPAFLNRLKNMELEPEKASIWSFFDPCLVLFQNHRPAMAAGLTVLIAIVLALTIVPGIINEGDDGETSMVAEAPPPAASDEEFQDEGMISKGLGERSAEPETEASVLAAGAEGDNGNEYTFGGENDVVSQTTTPASEHWPTPCPTAVPSSAVPPTTTGSMTGWNYGTCVSVSDTIALAEENDYEGRYQAIRIALDNEAVHNTLEPDISYCAIVFSGVMEFNDYVCSGSTVGIAVGETEPVTPVLYACVNSSSQMVTQIMVVSE